MRIVLTVLAAVALSGCFEYGSSSVFGPAGSDASADLPEWAFSVKAKPAQGPTPLLVTFTLDIRDGPVDLPWRADFGDGSPAATGRGPRATLEHVYVAQGLHAVYVTIGDGDSATRSTLAVTVLPPGAPPHPDEVVEATPLPREPPATQRAEGPGHPAPSSESATGSTTSPSSSSSTGPTSTPSSSSNSSTQSNSSSASPSSSSSSTSTASTSTSTDPGTSNSSSESPSSSPTESPSPSTSPTNSSSSSASDPPTETSSSSSPDTSTSATETTSPEPTNTTLAANLTADPTMATAPATVTFTVNVTDPAGDAAWNLTLDGVEVGFGTEADSPWSFNQTYDTEGNHTAVLTAWDGVETVRREVWVMVAAAEEPAA